MIDPVCTTCRLVAGLVSIGLGCCAMGMAICIVTRWRRTRVVQFLESALLAVGLAGFVVGVVGLSYAAMMWMLVG